MNKYLLNIKSESSLSLGIELKRCVLVISGAGMNSSWEEGSCGTSDGRLVIDSVGVWSKPWVSDV